MTKIVVTGTAGLLGWHAAARLHAANCAARFDGKLSPYELVLVDRAKFNNPEMLAAAISGADAVLHFAGVNRGTEEEVAEGNPSIAKAIAEAIRATGARPHIVYANSIQHSLENVYGRSKREAAAILADVSSLTDLVLPHIFGECARPDYNNVTATLIDRLWKGEKPVINDGATVSLLHAGEAANLAIAAAVARNIGEVAPSGRPTAVADIWAKLQDFHADYRANVFPAIDDPFDLALFNCYRTGGFPHHYPLTLTVREDSRGTLFETSKARSGSQSFVSSTRPGQQRGDHFHLSLVERFLVVSGEATIRIRRVLTDKISEFRVSGDEPVAIDMPPLHTHHIVNDGNSDVVTFFWANRLFDPADPDTYADPVFKENGAR